MWKRMYQDQLRIEEFLTKSSWQKWVYTSTFVSSCLESNYKTIVFLSIYIQLRSLVACVHSEPILHWTKCTEIWTERSTLITNKIAEKTRERSTWSAKYTFTICINVKLKAGDSWTNDAHNRRFPIWHLTNLFDQKIKLRKKTIFLSLVH